MHLQLGVTEGDRDPLADVGFDGLEPDEVTDAALRAALLGEPNRRARHSMGFLPEIADPLQPLRDAGVPDEIVRPLAELMVVDELLGSGRAARVTRFRLGTSIGGRRRLELEWEPPRRYANERRARTWKLEGRVEL